MCLYCLPVIKKEELKKLKRFLRGMFGSNEIYVRAYHLAGKFAHIAIGGSTLETQGNVSYFYLYNYVMFRYCLLLSCSAKSLFYSPFCLKFFSLSSSLISKKIMLLSITLVMTFEHKSLLGISLSLEFRDFYYGIFHEYSFK